jgi:hypothetical protein
MLKYVDS